MNRGPYEVQDGATASLPIMRGGGGEGIGTGPKRTKNPRGLLTAGVFLDKIRQHLLSHFWYYHRLGKLNDRVRDGNGCGLSEIVTGK